MDVEKERDDKIKLVEDAYYQINLLKEKIESLK